MTALFQPARIGTLELPNRFVRSATAEHMADADGRPRPQMRQLYRDLARGGVGLIISGHMFVHPSGKAHPEMTGIYADSLIPRLAALAGAVHEAGGLVAAQISHGGMQCRPEAVSDPMAPSDVDGPFLRWPAREMTPEEISSIVDAYGAAARRAQEAGFDAVQIHGAHGYLISEFLSPYTNRRADEWGPGGASGSAQALEGRTRFLRAVCRAIREQVGPDYPLFIKLGMVDGVEGGLTPEDGAAVVGALAEMGLDGVEISGGIGGGTALAIQSPIRDVEDEAYFRPLARLARERTSLPIALVGGLRSRSVMENVVESGDATFVSLSRPLICEPDLPERFRRGDQERAACISCDQCWPDEPGEGIACRLTSEKR